MLLPTDTAGSTGPQVRGRKEDRRREIPPDCPPTGKAAQGTSAPCSRLLGGRDWALCLPPQTHAPPLLPCSVAWRGASPRAHGPGGPLPSALTAPGTPPLPGPGDPSFPLWLAWAFHRLATCLDPDCTRVCSPHLSLLFQSRAFVSCWDPDQRIGHWVGNGSGKKMQLHKYNSRNKN